MGIVDRAEHVGHQGVAIELTFELQRLAIVPAIPDRVHRLNIFAHPGCRIAPRHAIAPLDMRLDLRSNPQRKSSARYLVEIIGRMRRQHRRPRQRDGNIGHHLDLPGPFGHQCRQHERVMLGFIGKDRVEAIGFPLRRLVHRLSRRCRHGGDLHGSKVSNPLSSIACTRCHAGRAVQRASQSLIAGNWSMSIRDAMPAIGNAVLMSPMVNPAPAT